MSEHGLSLEDLQQLRNFVHQKLCHLNELELGVFTFTERVLQQSNSPCGVFFCLHGPRSVKLIAIWDRRKNTILFYSSSGERVETIRLHRAPAI